MNYNLLKIKDNGINARSAGNVVYKRYMNCRHRVADMPLDFILRVQRIPGFQYSPQSFHLVR